jgi:hypothetical protein
MAMADCPIMKAVNRNKVRIVMVLSFVKNTMG